MEINKIVIFASRIIQFMLDVYTHNVLLFGVILVGRCNWSILFKKAVNETISENNIHCRYMKTKFLHLINTTLEDTWFQNNEATPHFAPFCIFLDLKFQLCTNNVESILELNV